MKREDWGRSGHFWKAPDSGEKTGLTGQRRKPRGSLRGWLWGLDIEAREVRNHLHRHLCEPDVALATVRVKFSCRCVKNSAREKRIMLRCRAKVISP